MVMRAPVDAAEIYHVPNFLSRSECRALIRLIDADLHPSRIYARPGEDPDFRTSQSCDFDGAEPEVRRFDERMTVLLGLHLLFIQRQGMSVPPSVERREKAGEKIPQIPFVPHYVLHDVMWWYVALAVLAALALFLPWELGKKADAFAAVPPGIRPEWYFLAMFQVLKLLPAHILGLEGEMLGVLGFGLAAIALLLLPFLDRGAADGRSSRLVTLAGVVALAYMVVFTIYGYLAA